MSAEEVEEVLDGARMELAAGLVALAGGWPAVVGLAGMAPDVQDVDAVLPETLYEFFAEELYGGLDPSVRTGLELLATMPFVDRELVVTLMGAERAELVVGEALALGLLDERDDRLVLHALAEEFLVRRGRAETQVEAAEAFPTAWAYYTSQKEPDAAFDLAHRLGVPSDIDRLLIDTMDELPEQRPAPDARDVGEPGRSPGRRDARSPRRPGRDRAPPRTAPDRAGAC